MRQMSPGVAGLALAQVSLGVVQGTDHLQGHSTEEWTAT